MFYTSVKSPIRGKIYSKFEKRGRGPKHMGIHALFEIPFHKITTSSALIIKAEEEEFCYVHEHKFPWMSLLLESIGEGVFPNNCLDT